MDAIVSLSPDFKFKSKDLANVSTSSAFIRGALMVDPFLLMKLSFFIDSAHPAKAKTPSYGGCCGLTDQEEEHLISHLALRLQHRLRHFLDKQGNAVSTLHNFRLNRKSLFPTRRSMMVAASRSPTAAANLLTTCCLRNQRTVTAYTRLLRLAVCGFRRKS
jgi:hypothetical protein